MPIQTRPLDLASWLWLIAAVLLALALRIPFFRIPMLADEGGYAWATRGWLDGTGDLYGDLWISRPQGIFIVYAGILEALGTNAIAMRFAAWIAIAITIVAVWGFARLCATPFAATLSAIIFAVTSSLPNLEGYSANAEVFMGLPAAFAALWLLRIRRTGWPMWQLLGVGIMIGVSTSLKPSGLVMLPVALIFIWLIGDGASHRVRWRRTLPILAGISFVALMSMIHGWWLGWSDFFYATILYRLSAQSAATVGLAHNLEAIWRLAIRALALILFCALVLVVRHRAAILAALHDAARAPAHLPRQVGAHLSLLRRTMRKPRNDGRFLLRLWLVGALCGAAIGGDWWAHYLIQMVAPVSVWLGWSIALTWPSLRGIGKWLYGFVGTVLLLVPFWVLVHGNHNDMARAMFSHPGYPAQDQVAAYLRDHTEPSDTIYVAFDQASIYYIADRPPAYRHLYDQELRGIPGSYAEIISIIRSPDRPKFIVSTRQPGPFADESRAFWQEVGLYYEVVETIADVPIYQDKTTLGS
jgi:4-amino-4-deoxy-L-arabinose transferase-like glycosyltransferase